MAAKQDEGQPESTNAQDRRVCYQSEVISSLMCPKKTEKVDKQTNLFEYDDSLCKNMHQLASGRMKNKHPTSIGRVTATAEHCTPSSKGTEDRSVEFTFPAIPGTRGAIFGC